VHGGAVSSGNYSPPAALRRCGKGTMAEAAA
jgi:hypothetical protein